jgi:hypothetical protein
LTNTDAPVLLPVFQYSARYQEIERAAATEHQNIAEHLGEDAVVRLINDECPLGIYYSTIVFDISVVLLFATVIFIFMFLAMGVV